MACTATTLTHDAKCLATALSTHQLLAAWAYLLCSGGPTPPPSNNAILGDPSLDPILGEDGSPVLGE